MVSVSKNRGRELRVLVAEREEKLAWSLRQALEEKGYAVDVALDGQRALLAAKEPGVGAVLLDLTLPALDGWAVLHALRAEGRGMPVLLLSPRDAVAEKVRGLDAGADDYLTKPFDIDELLARLRASIRRAAGHAVPVLKLREVEIDRTAGVVRKAGEVVDITAKEFALAELLARNSGKLVTRSMIYEQIYDNDDDTLSNVVDVHIFNLRRKLGKDFVTTRRGRGYIANA